MLLMGNKEDEVDVSGASPEAVGIVYPVGSQVKTDR